MLSRKSERATYAIAVSPHTATPSPPLHRIPTRMSRCHRTALPHLLGFPLPSPAVNESLGC